MAKKHILVAVNTLTSVNANPYRDHMAMFYRLGRSPELRNYEFHQMVANRVSIDRFRNTAAKVVRDNKFDYLFFIDDDMTFENPANVLKPLLKANLDIISAFTYIRGYPFDIMSFKDSGRRPNKHLVNLTEEDLLDSNPNKRSDGVILCDAIGTAVSLIKGDLIRKIPEPWFLTSTRSTEDIYFCCKAREYKKKTTIGMHSKVIIGHLLDPEIISYHTAKHLRDYYESYMTEDQVSAIRNKNKNIDRGKDYVKENIGDVEVEAENVTNS